MYLLDTNILSEFVKKRASPQLLTKVRVTKPEELFTSTICLMELRYGSRLRGDFDSFWSRLEKEVLSRVNGLTVENWLDAP